MKCLIIRKKWLDLILSGEKVWEMRSRKTNVRGRIGLIEAGSGMIVGECEIDGCRDFSGSNPSELSDYFYKYHRVTYIDALKKWNKAWMLKGAKRYDEPIKYNHPKGAVIWVNVSDETFS